MKVVLSQDVSNLGFQDEIKNVKPGYAKNFLFPRQFAMPATQERLAILEKKAKKNVAEDAKKTNEAKTQAKALESATINIHKKATADGKLFGAINKTDVVAAVKEQLNIALLEKNIELAKPIKRLGQFVVRARLYVNVIANIKLKIIK